MSVHYTSLNREQPTKQFEEYEHMIYEQEEKDSGEPGITIYNCVYEDFSSKRKPEIKSLMLKR